MKSEKPNLYFVPPPIIPVSYEYQNLNKDSQLRENQTVFFYKKTIKWIKNYKNFSHLKNKLKIIKSNKGKQIIYNLLKLFIKNTNINWYDLKDNYLTIKDFLKYKLGSI